MSLEVERLDRATALHSESNAMLIAKIKTLLSRLQEPAQASSTRSQR